MIVLSWFQNLFQKLRKEDDDDEFEGYIIHKPEGLPFLNKNESVKDLETKAVIILFIRQNLRKHLSQKNKHYDKKEKIRCQNRIRELLGKNQKLKWLNRNRLN